MQLLAHARRRRGRLAVLALALTLLLDHWWRRRRLAEVRRKFAACWERLAAEARTAELRAYADQVAVPAPAFPSEIDVVISGGGFWAIYAGSVCFALKRHGVDIVRISGTSAGAHTALMVLRGYDAIDEGFRWAIAMTETLRDEGHRGFMEDLWRSFFAERVEPPPPPGQLTVGITKLGVPLRSERVARFETGEELLDALVATARIPGLFGYHCANATHPWTLDGGASELCPLFTDGARPQLVLHWKDLRERFGCVSGFGMDASVLFEVAYLGIDNAHRLLRGETTVFAAQLVQAGEAGPEVAGLTRMTADHLRSQLRKWATAKLAGWPPPAAAAKR